MNEFKTKEDLMEASNDIAKEAASILNSLKRKLGPDGFDKAEIEGKFVNASYRNRDMFSARDGEEDDDQPNFTGDSAVQKIVDSAFKSIKDKVKVTFGPDEKSWFSINVDIL